MRRPQLSVFLILCALVLLVSIAVGQRMGDRVLGQVTGKSAIAIVVTPAPAATENAGTVRNLKRLQVISVATDPGFPDPRLTPPPRPTPTPYIPPPPTPLPRPTVMLTPERTAAPYVPGTPVPTPTRYDPGPEPTNENARPSAEPPPGRGAAPRPDITLSPEPRSTGR